MQLLASRKCILQAVMQAIPGLSTKLHHTRKAKSLVQKLIAEHPRGEQGCPVPSAVYCVVCLSSVEVACDRVSVVQSFSKQLCSLIFSPRVLFAFWLAQQAEFCTVGEIRLAASMCVLSWCYCVESALKGRAPSVQ